jgi:hypothetical protein
MQLIDNRGNRVSISAGFKIFYQPETQCVFFGANGRKLYFISREDKFLFNLCSHNQFNQLAWLIAQLCRLRIKACHSPAGVYACEFDHL